MPGHPRLPPFTACRGVTLLCPPSHLLPELSPAKPCCALLKQRTTNRSLAGPYPGAASQLSLYTERQVLAEFNQITSSKLGNDFVEALDCLTTQFIKLFKAKRGSAGAKLSKMVRHLDSCQRRWRKEKGTHQKRWWNCRKTLVTERSLKIIILLY
uniref:Uncharacterized protein n=1 Tax=Knipowitschia caucasica TaxID=637954 RepID=A0AAV2JIL3_KNICA